MNHEQTRSVSDPADVVHCLTIDVEGFVEGMEESFPIPDRYRDDASAGREIETNVCEILDHFDSVDRKATFFVLGRIAEANPSLMRKIANLGHELGSHSFYHKRIYNQTPAEFRSDLVRSKTALEQATGMPVIGFRAPDFSIRPDSLWILDEIKSAGFQYDTSLTPTDIHDVYGMKHVLPTIHRLDNGLWEFPASTFQFMGRKVPHGGGGYLRLYPTMLSRMLIRRCARSGHPAMIYSHPYELGSQVLRITPMSAYRRFRHYYNCGNAFARFEKILSGFKTAPVKTVLEQQGMGK